jgi:hypothetical protein
MTLCTDPRCTTTGTCWRVANERYGNAPGENYGPRCVPAPLAVQRTYEEGIAEGERRATAAVVAWLREVAPNAPTRRGADELAWCADHIERGEHRGGSK